MRNLGLTNNGNFRWAVSVGGIVDSVDLPGWGFESGTAICAEASGNVYATGAMFQGGFFGNTSLSQYGRTDVFITKLSSTPQTVVSSLLNKETILLYPSPNNGHFKLEIPKMSFKKIEITISNYIGQDIFKKYCETNCSLDIDLSSQEKGVYLLKARSDDNLITVKKIVVQ